MRTVARLSITPVKSTRLLHPAEVRLEVYGAVGNRRFYIAEPDGRLFNGSDLGTLMQITADYDDARESLELTFPDGSVVDGDASAIGGSVTTSFYGRPVVGSVLVGGWAEALSAFAGRPLILVRPPDPGDANDSEPASIVSSASVQELARRAGRITPLDAGRFRMLVEVAGCEPHEEDAWVGRQVRIGEALVEVSVPVSRCVVTTLDPSTGAKDFDTLKRIVAYRGLSGGSDIDFGVYARVIEPGTVRLGDEVKPS
jgi:uncharacterized protein YcbX